MNHLSIAVIGLGGIGSAFSYKLAGAGHEVTVIARPGSPRLLQLQRDRGIILKTGERADVRVTDKLDEQVAYDLVLVTLLAHQVDAVIPSLQQSKAKCIHFMFNNFNPERLRDLLGADRCSFGMPFVMASLDEEGKLNLKINPGQKTLHSDQRWVDLFSGAGLPSSYEGNMLLWLRCHTPMCIAFESICAAGEKRQGGASWSEAMMTARGVKGGFTVIKGLGYQIYPTSKAKLSSAPASVIASILWIISRNSTFRKLLATGVNECKALIGELVTAGSGAKPTHPEAIAAIRAMTPL